MAQNLTATKYAAQVLLTEPFQAKLYTDVFVKTPNALVGLLDKQRSNVRPIMDVTNAKRCQGYEAAFAKIDSETLPTIATSATNVACVIPAGEAMTSKKVTFTKDIYANGVEEYDDNVCADIYQDRLDMLVADLLLAASHKRVMALNGMAIARINTNVQVATYASDVGTISGGTVYIADLDLWKPQNLSTSLLPYFDDIAIHNGLPDDYIILGGSILGTTETTTDYIRANDDQAGEGRAFDAYADKMVIDRRGMLDAGLSENVFLIDPRVYGFALNSIYDNTPMQSNDANNTVKFSMPLVYAAGGVQGTNAMQVNTLMYWSGGQMVEARLDFRQQVTCATGNTDGYTYDITRMESILNGIMAFAPNDGGARTGIVKIQRGTP